MKDEFIRWSATDAIIFWLTIFMAVGLFLKIVSIIKNKDKNR